MAYALQRQQSGLKKYLYADGVQRLNRLHDIGRTLKAHVPPGLLEAEFRTDENLDNARYIHENLGNMRDWLFVATFFDVDAEPDRDKWPDGYTIHGVAKQGGRRIPEPLLRRPARHHDAALGRWLGDARVESGPAPPR